MALTKVRGKGVDGGTISTETAGTNNLILGSTAGDSIASGGNYNVCIGDEAGTALTTGDNNVAVGFEALNTEDTQGHSVAVGYQALKTQNSSATSENTAVGYHAGTALTTGVESVFVGYDAGAALTIGTNNTLIGGEAGKTMVGDNNNVAVGWGALKLQTNSGSTATNNTAVGYSAGAAITTGTQNTLVGLAVGDATTNGSNNVMVGYNLDNSTGVGSDHAIVIGHNFSGAANDFSFGKASNVVSNDFDADANWSRSSDSRLKKNITDQKLGLDFVNDLRTVKYNWKPSHELDSKDSQLAHLYKKDEADNEMNTTVTMHNFIAQEVKAALDKAGVSDFGGWKEDDYGVQQISREMFVIPLVKAVQELSAKNDALEARIKKLEDG